MTPITIAVAGKGGTGKTTTCGMLIEYLAKSGKGPILAVDADANANLNEVLGVDVGMTLGDIRENIARADITDPSPIPAGMTKQEYAEFMFNSALIEADEYDLLVMGRTQGKGCYCYVNGVLKAQVEKFSGNYRYVVVDNEAGLEHISRGTLPSIDILLLVSDCSRRGIQAVGRIQEMVNELNLKPRVMQLIVNRAPNGVLDDGVLEEIQNQQLDLLGILPQDDAVYQYDCAGKPSASVPEDSPIKLALSQLIRKLAL
ncbi:MAG: AAA family ATPase [Clostridia bacterium]